MYFNDLYDIKINKKIAIWYIEKRIPQLLKSKNLKITTENILISYQAGVERIVDNQITAKTRRYVEDYNRLNKGAKK